MQSLNHIHPSPLVEVLLHPGCWAENLTRACCTESRRTTNWATPHPNELRGTLVNYTAHCWAVTHPFEVYRNLTELRPTLTELRCTLVSYAISELRCTSPPTELRRTLTQLRHSLTQLHRTLSELSYTMAVMGHTLNTYHSGFNWQHHYSRTVKYWFCDDHFINPVIDVGKNLFRST